MTHAWSAAALLTRVRESEFLPTHGWTVDEAFASDSATVCGLRCRSELEPSWRIGAALSAVALATAIEQVVAGQVEPDGTRIRTGIAVPDTELLRATAEAHLAGLIRRNGWVFCVSADSVECFPADDADLILDLGLLSEREVEELALEPGTIERLAEEL